MPRVSLGSLCLDVDHRAPGAEGGPTLRVRRASDARELLRFDCFARGAHWHADPEGRDEITPLGPEVDAVEWVLGELRRDLAGYVAKAGETPSDLSGERVAAALDRVEPALRNPPPELEHLDVAVLRERRGEKWSAYPEDVLPLWVADMDFDVAEPIRRRLQRALDVGDLGYPMHPRPTSLPAVFAARAARLWGWEVEPRRVELLTDVVQGIYVALHEHTRPGEGVVVQTPIYPPFLGAVAETGRELLESPLRETADGYRVDVDHLRELGPRARAMLLCNPHNPSGRVFTREELEGIAEVAVAHDWLVVSDEIHADLVHPGARHVPLASLGAAIEARTLTLNSASKAFNIAGLRCAVAVFGSDALKRRFLGLPRHLRGGLGSLGIEATLEAWTHADPWLEAVRSQLEANRDLVVEFVGRELPGVRIHRPEATYLAWLDCRALELAPSPYAFFLREAKVALSDGAAFGPPGRGFVRINFATSPSILTEALERMAEALRSRS
jgi:cystathionine beta-lyase